MSEQSKAGGRDVALLYAPTDDGKGEITEYTEAPPDAPANGVPAVH